MSQNNSIETILKQAQEKRWPYPQTFQALKEAGVETYTVRWGEDYYAEYIGSFGVWTHHGLQGWTPLLTAPVFSENDLKASLIKHQQGKSDYVSFLKEASAAGVTHYRVEMDKRTVSYYDREERHSYVEKVPS